MTLLQLYVLNSKHMNDIYALNELCTEYAQSHHNPEYSYEPYYEEDSQTDIHCFSLLYDSNILIGMASALLYEDGAEITGMIHPQYRNHGFFKRLVTSLCSELHDNHIFSIYGSIPSSTDNTALTKSSIFGDISHIEYLLIYKQNFPSNRFLRSIPSDMHFHKSNYNKEASTIAGKYSLKKSNCIISHCNLSEDGPLTNIWGVATKEPYRNQGYGSMLINYVIKDYFENNDKPLILNVTSSNKAAYKLYRNCGFQVQEAITYYQINLS